MVTRFDLVKQMGMALLAFPIISMPQDIMIVLCNGFVMDTEWTEIQSAAADRRPSGQLDWFREFSCHCCTRSCAAGQRSPTPVGRYT